MNIRYAILKAADHIEQIPRLFDFGKVRIPNDCGTPGCALGWIGHFYGIENFNFDRGCFYGDVLCVGDQLLETPQQNMHVNHPFYQRLDALSSGWRRNASKCAVALRLYVDKYHPAEKALDPQFVRFRDSLYREFAMEKRSAQRSAL